MSWVGVKISLSGLAASQDLCKNKLWWTWAWVKGYGHRGQDNGWVLRITFHSHRYENRKQIWRTKLWCVPRASGHSVTSRLEGLFFPHGEKIHKLSVQFLCPVLIGFQVFFYWVVCVPIYSWCDFQPQLSVEASEDSGKETKASEDSNQEVATKVRFQHWGQTRSFSKALVSHLKQRTFLFL